MSVDGRFYPNQSIQMTEQGDLGTRTEYAVSKPVNFQTDAYGFRFNGSGNEDFDIVIIGDSFTVGSALSQEDTLAVQLSEVVNRPIYPYAPSNIIRYFQDGRFSNQTPEFVILQQVERNLNKTFCPNNQVPEMQPASSPFTEELNWQIRFDLALRNPFYFYNYARAINNDKEIIVNPTSQMLFHDRSLIPPTAEISDIVQELLNCQEWLSTRGSELIFMPIPNKESIYFDDIPHEFRPEMSYDERRTFLADLIIEANRAGITTVDLLTPYEQAREGGIIMYHLDDTHWNTIGVQIAVDELRQIINAEISLNH